MPRSTRSRATAAKPGARSAARTKPAPNTKAASKKVPTKKTAAAKKAVPAKKAAAKKAVVKKATVNKAAAKKAPPKKVAAKAAPAKAASKRAAAKRVDPPKKAGSAKKTAVKTASRRFDALGATQPPKPKPAKSPYDSKFLEAQRVMLLEERETYTRQAASLQAEADALVNDYEPGDVQFDEESGEGDTLAVERERDLALSAQARQAVSEIDHALAKIAAGTYGLCEVSGLPIPKERLKAIPWARERVEYKAAGIGGL
jgi:RNA polymerase-binding transcription factor DksA